MSDLISRSELLTRIRLNYNNHQNISASAIKDMIYTTPTSYDIGKVVDELEKLKDKGSVTKTEMLITKSCVDKAIEIVKHGGVSDDVCEWNLDGVYIFSPHSKMFSCVIDDKHRYTYCPVCGKKIKVVE